MNRPIRFFALAFIALLLVACHKGHGGNINVPGDVYTARPEVFSPYKVKVADVFNDTRDVYDVDVIGIMWSGIEDSLKKRGMLLGEKAEGDFYVLEVHITAFEKGAMVARCLPYLGDSVLTVRAELSRGGKNLATIESKRKISFGKSTMTREAWKKLFDEVSEDIVNQAVKKF